MNIAIGITGGDAVRVGCDPSKHPSIQPSIFVHLGEVGIYSEDPDALRRAARAFDEAAAKLAAALTRDPS